MLLSYGAGHGVKLDTHLANVSGNGWFVAWCSGLDVLHLHYRFSNRRCWRRRSRRVVTSVGKNTSRMRGDMDSASLMSADTYVSGRSLIIASISTIMVCNSSRVTNDRPHVFLTADLVTPISLSHQPPYQGALVGMNFHAMPMLEKFLWMDGDCIKFCRWRDAALNVVALSDNMVCGMDFRLANRRKAFINASSVKLGTTSRYTARVDAQVKRQIYTFFSLPEDSRIDNAPVKSTPVTVNGGLSSINSLGKYANIKRANTAT